MFHSFTGEFEKYKDSRFINLNNGTLGLSPSSVIDQQKTELERFEMNTSMGYGEAWQRLWVIQERLGLFINAKASDLFLRPNVTLAMNEIIMGLSLPDDSEILTTHFEYGAVVKILKMKAQKDRLSLRFIQPEDLYKDITADQAVEILAKEFTDKTKALVISHIFIGNGIEMPLKKLASICRKKGVLLIIDGAHAPGMLNLDFKSDLNDVDFYGGNLHKWMMGPKGTAFAWVNPIHQEKTFPVYGSWTTDSNAPPTMHSFANHPFAQRMLWSHTFSFNAFFGLEKCFDFWDQYGKEFIFKEIALRMKYLEDGLQAKGLTPLKSVNAKVPARLLGYDLKQLPKFEFEGLFIKGSDPRIQVGLPRIPGASILRLTPHIQNTQAELDAVILAFSRLV
ncbi:aminotransferase class V-fold PLP-dependent enzyme [Bdellovibrio sp. HCB290]|uniref:aminotransferase class V-fold PLP-dependent enzyme n=1 Tax=Bdellovibrio sp. HCB290 TaxID=3394356 RepID=UPI0039B4012D